MSRVRALTLLTFMALLVSAVGLGQERSDWRRFRGPNGSGVADVTGLPTEFGPEAGVAWRQPVPAGKSSPVLGDQHVFLTAVDGDELVVLAFDRETGAPAWRTAVAPGYDVEMYPANNGASPTPVTDGENVFVVFGTMGVLALDGTGEEMWRLPVGPLATFYGHSASPVLAGDTLILLFDQRQESYLLGLDRLTGDVLWRRERPARVESWTTPVLYPDDRNPEQVLVAGSTWLDSYSLETGEPFWAMPGLPYWPIASPTFADGILLVAGPDQAGEVPLAFAAASAEVDTDGDGVFSRAEMVASERFQWVGNHFGFGDSDGNGTWDQSEYEAVFLASVTDGYGSVGVRLPAPGSRDNAEVIWRDQRAVPYHATPLIHDGMAYFVADNGIVSVYAMETGELLRRDRLSTASTNLAASPVMGDDKIYLATQDGAVVVLSTGVEWEVLAVNDLGEPLYATPALGEGRLYVRTDGFLYAFDGAVGTATTTTGIQ
jgi:outer membrane protein assembly factor BamB